MFSVGRWSTVVVLVALAGGAAGFTGPAATTPGLKAAPALGPQQPGAKVQTPRAHMKLREGSTSVQQTAAPADVLTERDMWQEIPLDELKAIRATAEKAARAAGEIIINNLGAPAQQTKFNIKDIVTEYDIQAQEGLQSIIREAYPEHSFLGEEDVDPGAAASEAALINVLGKSPSGWVWIVDPIDGTANFASGLPLVGVTVSVAYKGTVVVGVIYDPNRDEMFSAIKGNGAVMNGSQQLKVGPVELMKDAIVNAGCPADPNAFDTSMKGMKALSTKTRGIRVIACSAVTLAWIAAGRLTAHFGYDLSSWDLTAGALLIQEAGGKVTDLDGSAYRIETRNMLCSNGKVHDEVLDALTEVDAVSFTRSK